MEFHVTDAIDRWTILDNDVKLFSKTGKEKLVEKSEPIQETLMFSVDIEFDLPEEDNLINGVIINNLIKALFITYGEQCLDEEFLTERFQRHFSVMKIKSVKISKLDKFYKGSSFFRGKETAFSSPIISLGAEKNNI